MPTSTVENYIKQVYLEHQRTGGKLVSLGRLATETGVVPGTVTTMVKALAESGLVRYRPRQGVLLTPAGQKLALHVLRRHRLIELFLVRVLGFDWSEVHAEAEVLEHVISDKLLDRIDKFLGHPGFDPHGDPIPTARGKLASSSLRSLAACRASQSARIARIADQDAQFLKFANIRRLIPGATVTIENRDEIGDSITLRVNGAAPFSLGSSAASKILVDSHFPSRSSLRRRPNPKSKFNNRKSR